MIRLLANLTNVGVTLAVTHCCNWAGASPAPTISINYARSLLSNTSKNPCHQCAKISDVAV
jgi:hypothetical protein